jgi:phage terminase large subunit
MGLEYDEIPISNGSGIKLQQILWIIKSTKVTKALRFFERNPKAKKSENHTRFIKRLPTDMNRVKCH